MAWTIRGLFAGAVVVWATAVGFTGVSAEPAQKATTADGVYTKAQAEAGATQFAKMCADCHPFSEAAKKQAKDVPLGGETFLKAWQGRTLQDLANLIVLTMPNDGSGEVTEEESAGLVAYILQQNEYPAGATALTFPGMARVVVRPKK